MKPIFTQSPLWCSLFIPSESRKTLRLALEAIYQAAGFVSYNPFAGGAGTPSGAKRLNRLFIAPKSAGWIRVLGEPDEALIPELASQLNLPLWLVWVGESEGAVTQFGEVSPELLASLHPAPASLPFGTPSADPLQDFAAQQGLSLASAEGLIQKTTRSLFQKMGEADQQEAAAGLIQKRFSWQSPAAQAVLAQVVNLRLLPSNWYQPSFEEVAAAYQLAALLEQNPALPLLASEASLLDQVAYPLDYKPIYYALS